MGNPELIPLREIAHGRSGDKGNHANVAVLAYTPAGFAWLREHLTAEVVQRYFAPLHPSRVVRYEAPNLLAVNFVLHDVLAGGASGRCGPIPRVRPTPWPFCTWKSHGPRTSPTWCVPGRRGDHE